MVLLEDDSTLVLLEPILQVSIRLYLLDEVLATEPFFKLAPYPNSHWFSMSIPAFPLRSFDLVLLTWWLRSVASRPAVRVLSWSLALLIPADLAFWCGAIRR